MGQPWIRESLRLMYGQESFYNQKAALNNAINLGINQLNSNQFVEGEASKQKMLNKLNGFKS